MAVLILGVQLRWGDALALTQRELACVIDIRVKETFASCGALAMAMVRQGPPASTWNARRGLVVKLSSPTRSVFV